MSRYSPVMDEKVSIRTLPVEYKQLFSSFEILEGQTLASVLLRIIASRYLQMRETQLLGTLTLIWYGWYSNHNLWLDERDKYLLIKDYYFIYYYTNISFFTVPLVWLHKSHNGIRAFIIVLPSSEGIIFCLVITVDTAQLKQKTIVSYK